MMTVVPPISIRISSSLRAGSAAKRSTETEFVQEAQGRGVDGVAPEVAQEVPVFLQDRHLDAGSGEQEPQHHPRRPPADDAAGRALYRRRSPHVHHSLVATGLDSNRSVSILTDR